MRKPPVFKTFLAVFLFSALFSFSGKALAATVLDVPFTSQAPFGNWASPWQDYCEEASVVMAAHFVMNLPITPKFADLEMGIIKEYENAVFGRNKDNSADEMARVLKELYGFKNISVKEIRSVADIKNEISAGRAVIVPAAGRLLKNPYFVPPGPFYHMLVVRGFDDIKKVFIANDPGTRRGNGIEYKQILLFDSIHDWNSGDVMKGKKNIIIIGK